MRKSLFAALMAVLLLSMVLCGCKKDGDAVSEAQTPEPIDEVIAPDGSVVIRLLRCTYNLDAPDKEQVAKVENAINKYIQPKINVTVKLNDMTNGDYPKTAEEYLDKDKVDLLWTASWMSKVGTNELVAHNKVADLTELLKDTALYKSMSEEQWSASSYDDKNYFVPVYKDNSEGYDLMFRQDLVDRFGWNIDNITNLADIEAFLDEAKKNGIEYPYLTQRTPMFYRWYIDKFDFFTANYESNFLAIDKNKNAVIDTVMSPEYEEFCHLMARWADRGYINPDDANPNSEGNLVSGDNWAISWWTDVPVNDEADVRYDKDMTMHQMTSRWIHSTSNLGSCYCVNAKSDPKRIQACVDFLNLLFNDIYLADLYTYGIEGEDFDYNADGQVVLKSDKYNHSMWESVSATTVTPLENEPANKPFIVEEFNKNSNISPATGFRFTPVRVANEYQACCKVYMDYGFKLENGGVPEEMVDLTIEDYQKALDEAGFQKVFEEFNAQYEAWKRN